MAENKGNTAVPDHGDHDRVTMLSLKADGTPDQNNPELIGDKQFALDATRRQYEEQAVSAVDVRERGVTANTDAKDIDQDPEIQRLKDAHDKAADAAKSAADSTVGALFNDDAPTTTNTETDLDSKSSGSSSSTAPKKSTPSTK
jgi:hypothetical protein